VAYDRDRIRADLGRFMRQYQRKRAQGIDPNDRTYDRKLEELIKRMPPEELDRLLHDDEDEADE
jgi:hypothetical protein